MNCFWCEKEIIKHKTYTKDHLVSRPLAKFLHMKERPSGWVVPSCGPCNRERGDISCCLEAIRKFKPKKKKAFGRIDAFRNKIMPIIKKYEEKLKKLDSEKLEFCTKELTAVLEFKVRQQP